MVDVVHEMTVRQFLELRPETRLVILHPWLVQRGLVISEFLTDDRCAYVRFEGSNLKQAEIEQQLERALETQDCELATATLIVLDECDLCEQQELAAALVKVCDGLTDGRVLAISRNPLRGVMEMESLRSLTECIPCDEELMLHDYMMPRTQALLEVQALGTGHVCLDGNPVTTWDGMLPRALFFYLVDRGMTTRNEIFATFWPNLTVREATNVFHVTKRKISEVLGIDLTSYWSGFYHISQDIDLSYDVSHFTERVQQSAVRSGEDAQKLMGAADWLYRGDFLAGMEMDWANERRNELRQAHGDVLVSLAKELERSGLTQDALGLYLRAYKTNRLREDIIFDVMRLYNELDSPQDSLEVYEVLRKELDEMLHVEPEKYVQELAETIALRV
ncbi:MAG: hypothetical protein K8L99_26100 [Anaerolineae bacterium]|nr:hypothetical protein [Anaerolineae bacterium]